MVSRFRAPWFGRDDTTVLDTVDQVSVNSSSDATPTADEKHAEYSHAEGLQIATEDIPKIAKSHQWDPKLPKETLDVLYEAAKTGDPEKILEIEPDFAEDSPYDEVRAAVRLTDGEEVANTVRAWVLGMIFVTIGSGLNMFLSMRSPAINFPAIVIQLVVYPIGCLWARIMPTRVFNTFGLRWTLNTGPFTIKEHVVIVLMANVSIGYAYSTDALLALKAKPLYNIDLGW